MAKFSIRFTHESLEISDDVILLERRAKILNQCDCDIRVLQLARTTSTMSAVTVNVRSVSSIGDLSY